LILWSKNPLLLIAIDHLRLYVSTRQYSY